MLMPSSILVQKIWAKTVKSRSHYNDAIAFSKLTLATLEQGVKYVQS